MTTTAPAPRRSTDEQGRLEAALTELFDKRITFDQTLGLKGLGQHFIATGEVLRLGGRVATMQRRLINDEGTLIAAAIGAYMVS